MYARKPHLLQLGLVIIGSFVEERRLKRLPVLIESQGLESVLNALR